MIVDRLRFIAVAPLLLFLVWAEGLSADPADELLNAALKTPLARLPKGAIKINPQSRGLSLDLFDATDADLKLVSHADAKTCKSFQHVNIVGQAFKTEKLPGLEKMENVVSVSILDSSVSVEICRSFVHLKRLDLLVISNSGLTDDGVKEIGKAESLRHLVIDGNPIQAGSFQHLRKLRKLVQISAFDTPIDDTDVRFIRELPGIAALQLGGTKVTDKCIPDISSFADLELVVLTRTAVTKDGLAKLEAAKPNVLISGGGAAKDRKIDMDK